MEAPEKIYLFENPISGTPDDRWLSKRSDEKDIEYTHTDAFIHKACEWIKEHSYDYLEFGEAGFGANFQYPKMIEDFRKAMKGE